MKKNLTSLAFLCLMAFSGCKKSDSTPPTQTIDPPAKIDYSIANANGLQLAVSNLTAKTSITIFVTDYNRPTDTLMKISNLYGNKSYYTKDVSKGQKCSIFINSNVVADVANNGTGIITFYYKSEILGINAGNFSYPAGKGTTVVIP
ncbi:hypothetical protein [Mucilaginibacter sp.]|uniref:hypothetical protein n=1 Tax=Mucilaginibacter sp. TaxID=1882438 RepID=UPI0025FDE83E|nr:hypothetical protein [Mucilaginibacter sp.]